MKLTIDQLGRKMWGRAKSCFANSYLRANGSPYVSTQIENFYREFGRENNMQVIIDDWVDNFPVINSVEFVDEKSYALFILKWA